MTLSSIELWQRISAEGLASPMLCRSWAAETAKNLPPVDTADGIKVLGKLVELGKLTRYQSQILAGQSPQPLKRGAWHILQVVEHPIWDGWLEITKIDTSKGEQPAPRWARWMQAAEMEKLRASAPSLPRGILLAKIQADHLQQIEMPELVDRELQLRIAPVAGQSLIDLCKNDLPSWTKVNIIVQQAAEALAAMHSMQVVHGRVMPDRIFWDDQAGATLVRDPISVWTATVDPSICGILRQQLGPLQVAGFLAPEFLAPTQPPSMASDIYAIGATWWWLLKGRPPVEGPSTAAILGLAAEKELAIDEQLSDLPEPFRICLQHCLAKNPPARFPNAAALVQALHAAASSVSKGKVIVARAPLPGQTSSTPSQQAPTSAAQSTVQQTSTASVLSKDTDSTVPTEIVRATLVESNDLVESAQPLPATSQASNSSQAERQLAQPVQKAQQPIKAQPVSQTKPKVKDRQEKVAAEPVVSQLVPKDVPATQTGQATGIDLSLKGSPASTQPASTASVPASAPSSASSAALAMNQASQKSSTRMRRRTKRKSKLPLYLMAGIGFVAIMLGILKISGALDGNPDATAQKQPTFQPPVVTTQPKEIPKDPLLDHYRVVDSKDLPWAPVQLPDPIALDLMPPGAQWLLWLRPADLLNNQHWSELFQTFSQEFQVARFDELSKLTGQPLSSIKSVLIGFYAAPSADQLPAMAIRVDLNQVHSIDKLNSGWGTTSEVLVGQEKIIVNEKEMAWLLDKEADPSAISRFCTGPVALIKEAAELGGIAPLNTQLKQLHARSSQAYPIVMLGSPRYLFREGRELLNRLPSRLLIQVEPILGVESRGALLQTSIGENWYWELLVVGATDADSPGVANRINQATSTAADQVEKWLVTQTPHPYWRALAMRYPQMIRSWREYSRFGVEDGAAIINGYMPPTAASNLVIATWIASQATSTLAGGTIVENPVNEPAPMELTLDEFLNRPIRLNFEQEPIEKALVLVGDEANRNVPTKSQLRFELDGSAFERAGITRNQQLRDFRIDNRPVRDALTEIAKRGNPVTTVKDTREKDQRLIWVAKDDPDNANKKMISLTTRDAAESANYALPIEFGQ